MGLFYLLTLYCAIRASDGPRQGWWAAAAVVACAAGMGTKETMVTAPLMVALWDYLFGGSEKGRPAGIRWRLVGALAATWLLLAFLVSREFRGPSVDLLARNDLAVPAHAGRGGDALPAARVLSVAAGLPLRLAARSGSHLDGMAGRAADRAGRPHRRWHREAPPGGLPRRVVLPHPGALIERAADCDGSRGRAPDVPAARRGRRRRRHRRAPGCDAVPGTLDAGRGWRGGRGAHRCGGHARRRHVRAERRVRERRGPVGGHGGQAAGGSAPAGGVWRSAGQSRPRLGSRNPALAGRRARAGRVRSLA